MPLCRDVRSLKNRYRLNKQQSRLTSDGLHSGDSFVLQNSHHYATVFRLSFRRLIVADLVAFSHRTWSQHSGQGNLALLKQDVGHCVGTVFAELLI